MAKYNTRRGRQTPGAARSPITTELSPSGKTHEGAAGYARDAKSELFLMAVSSFAGEQSFYESAGEQHARLIALVHGIACDDPEWLLRFTRWLRGTANIRTAAIVIAAEAVKARRDAGAHGMSREIVRAAIQRADEPGEMLAYWMSQYGRTIPTPMKRGIGDRMIDMVTEFSYLKYGNSSSRSFSFADVINLTHPGDRTSSRQSIRDIAQHELFKYILTVRYHPNTPISPTLRMLSRRKALMELPAHKRREVLLTDPTALRDAGMTWESLAGWLQGPMDAHAWEAIIPSMGYMALLRNLRNFDAAYVSDSIASDVIRRLTDPEAVQKSKQLPMRFLSAHRATQSVRWAHAIEVALNLSLSNIPQLDGKTLILIDTSGSMNSTFSKDGKLKRWDAAAMFGIALGARCEKADIVSFSGGWYSRNDDITKVFPKINGESLLRSIDRWGSGGYFIGGGTETAAALRKHYLNHDRVVILTDEQAMYGEHDVNSAIPQTTPMYTWNLAGYKYGHAPSDISPTRHTFGGLTDKGFEMIPLLERGAACDWPF